MANIFINGKFLTQRQTGAQRYAREIVAGIDKMCISGEFVLVLPKGEWNIPHLQNIKVVKVGPFKGVPWEQITLPCYIAKQGGLCLNLCNVAPLLKPDYSTIFDMKIKSFPLFFNWKFRVWYSLLFTNQTKRCKVIFTDSHDAKNELLKYYPDTNPEKVIPAHGAWQHFNSISNDEHTLTKYGLEKRRYFFAMGSLEPNKNFKWVAEIAKRNPNDMFAVAGALNPKVFADGLGFECPPNMKLLGFVSDEEAKTLMRDAKAFLFPSFCEGFGMPPLEALSAGVPRVVVSDIPVMHEIFEENAIYINPCQYDYDLDKMITNSSCDAEGVLRRFSWEKSARIIYEELKKQILQQ